jgi:hypothetical protein
MAGLITLVCACSNMPTNTALLEQTRSEYIAAQSNPKVATFAEAEMKQASEAYAQANAASDHGDSADKVDKLAMIAREKIRLAQESATRRADAADFSASPGRLDRKRMQQHMIPNKQ